MGDYEEEEVGEAGGDAKNGDAAANGDKKKEVKGTYVSIHSSGFRDFLLKPEVLRAIVDCGFEHPSEVQHECIPQAVLGMDILCQMNAWKAFLSCHGTYKSSLFQLATTALRASAARSGSEG